MADEPNILNILHSNNPIHETFKEAFDEVDSIRGERRLQQKILCCLMARLSTEVKNTMDHLNINEDTAIQRVLSNLMVGTYSNGR